MTHPLNSLLDTIVQQAEANGDFMDLPGMGKPLENLSAPRDAVLNHLMAEAQAKPPAVALKQQITASRARLKELTGEDARKAEMKVLADLEMRLAIEMEAMRKYG